MTTYITKQDGEVLDAICLAELGDVAHLAATLDLNPGLASVALILPIETVIELPAVPAPVEGGQIRLWGRT